MSGEEGTLDSPRTVVDGLKACFYRHIGDCGVPPSLLYVREDAYQELVGHLLSQRDRFGVPEDEFGDCRMRFRGVKIVSVPTSIWRIVGVPEEEPSHKCTAPTHTTT